MGNDKTGNAKTGNAKTGNAKTGNAKTGNAKSGNAKTKGILWKFFMKHRLQEIHNGGMKIMQKINFLSTCEYILRRRPFNILGHLIIITRYLRKRLC